MIQLIIWCYYAWIHSEKQSFCCISEYANTHFVILQYLNWLSHPDRLLSKCCGGISSTKRAQRVLYLWLLFTLWKKTYKMNWVNQVVLIHQKTVGFGPILTVVLRSQLRYTLLFSLLSFLIRKRFLFFG